MSNTTVNGQVTDSITQISTQVLGDAPAIAMGNLFMATSQALSLAALNATNAQQQNNITAQASTIMGITTLYSINKSSTAVSAADIFKMIIARK